MPSRPLLSPPPPDAHQANNFLPPLAGGVTAAFSCLLLLVLCFRRISKKRTAPSASDTDSKKPPHRVSYSVLRRATANFSPSLRLGQGGFGSVYRADLKASTLVLKDSAFTSSHVAVKVMDSGSLQGEREFQNELLFSSKIDCKYIVSVMGFSSNRRKRRMLLVYELMENGSLQDCLFHKKNKELRNWNNRFSIALNIARGLEYLHHHCEPPIIHGDIKPSNILLDARFSAKISDFGLARFKSEENDTILGEVKKESNLGNGVQDNGSVVEDTESVVTVNGHEEVNNVHNLENMDTSPESVIVRVENSPEELVMVKDYVMEWIGNEIINEERPKTESTRASTSSEAVISTKAEKKKKKRRQLDWWVSLDDEKNVKKKEKRRPAREWWKEEYCDELEKKKKKKKKQKQVNGSMSDDFYHENWDDELYSDRNKKRSRSRNSSRGSMERWLDGLSGELFRARKNSYDTMSGGISSTPSMRGTLCYVAPEYGSGSHVSEKCDVYSYGILLLVLIAGRRPLHVSESPVSEFKRANLLSWARSLARKGKLLDLVDHSVEFLDKEQARMCIKVALLCLQKLPSQRPSMKDVVGMLNGELDCPKLPIELSPFKSHRKGR